MNLDGLLSSVPRAERHNHAVVVLQTHADDSGSSENSEFFSVAGFVAPRETWDGFSPVWGDVCQEPRKITFFKSNHAIGLKKEFQGFTRDQRDLKVARLAHTIADFNPLRIGATLRRSDYVEAFSTGFQKSVTSAIRRMSGPSALLPRAIG